MRKPLALVVDDEPDICELLAITLERMDIDADTCGDVATAKTRLGSSSECVNRSPPSFPKRTRAVPMPVLRA